MNMRMRFLGSLSGLAAIGLCAHALADDGAVVQAKWKPQEIHYSYVGFTTAYDCDAAAVRVKSILTMLGAHPDTKVRASGCPSNRPSRTFFLTITTATPVPVAEFKQTSSDKSRQELIDRLGGNQNISNEEFPAAWKTVELSKQRQLNIRPGDCELMEGLRDKVLPKMGVKIEEERITCTPNQVSIQPPQLRVSSLVPVKSADTKSEAS